MSDQFSRPNSGHSVAITTASASRTASIALGATSRSGSARRARASAFGSGQHDGAGRPQVGREGERRRSAHAVRVGLERQAEETDATTGQRSGPAQQAFESRDDLALMDRVRAVDGRQQRRHDVERDGLQRDRDRLFGQARATDPGTGPQEGGPDPPVEADARDDLVDVGPRRVGDPGELVRERDLHAEKDVGPELDQRDRAESATSDGAPSGAYSANTARAASVSLPSQPATTRLAVKVLERLARAHEPGLVTMDGRSVFGDEVARRSAGQRQGRSDDDRSSCLTLVMRRSIAASTKVVDSGPSGPVGG
jgi:hypothetical protein